MGIGNFKNKMKQFYRRVQRLWYVKYIVVCVLGILVVGFLDDNSVLSHVNNLRRKGELKKEIELYNAQNKTNLERIDQLDRDPKAMEKIARERYFMKTEDEDIFVLSDDEGRSSTPVPVHETVE
jgi:cell division protein FtsB